MAQIKIEDEFTIVIATSPTGEEVEIAVAQEMKGLDPYIHFNVLNMTELPAETYDGAGALVTFADIDQTHTIRVKERPSELLNVFQKVASIFEIGTEYVTQSGATRSLYEKVRQEWARIPSF